VEKNGINVEVKTGKVEHAAKKEVVLFKTNIIINV